MKASSFELEQAAILASRLCAIPAQRRRDLPCLRHHGDRDGARPA
jgi:hypothetical protein